MVSNELSGRMCEAYLTTYGLRWSEKDDQTHARMGMTAALRVAADALLEPITEAELCAYPSAQCPVLINKYGFNNIMRDRRARLEAPAKTPEERIADLLIAKGPDTPASYRAIAAEIVATLKEGKQ